MLNLKKYRMAAGLTQTEAADALGISLSRYNNYERGVRECHDFELLLRMGELFGVTVQQLVLGGNENSAPADARRSAVIEKITNLSDAQLDRLLAALEMLDSGESHTPPESE